MLTISQQEFGQRRQQLLEKLPKDGIALIPSAKEILRNGLITRFNFVKTAIFGI